MRAMATRHRYWFCANPDCSPSCWLLSSDPVQGVVLGCDLERAAGMRYGLDQIAASQCIARTMHGNGSWQRLVFLFVHDDHARPLSVRLCGRREPPLGVTQALVDAVQLAA